MATTEHQVEILIGHMLALKAGVSALIATHPNQADLRQALEIALNIDLGKVEPLRATTKTISAYQDMASHLRKVPVVKG